MKEAPIWKARLKAEVGMRGLTLEEIVMGETREGLSFDALGWKNTTDIPWSSIVIGSSNNDRFEQDLSSFVVDGKLVDNWKDTLLGKALTKLGIDPEVTDSRFKKSDGTSDISQWDRFWEIQSSLRNLREVAQVQRTDGSPARDLDLGLHHIQRFNTSMDNDAWEDYTQMPPERQRKQPRVAGETTGNSDWRMWGPTYQRLLNSSRDFEKRARALRKEK